jgi:hypothetical protein
MPTTDPEDDGRYDAADAAMSKLLFNYMKEGRRIYLNEGAHPLEAFTRTYWALINCAIAGAVAYEIPEAIVHEMINTGFTNANTDEGKAELARIKRAARRP